MSIACYRGGHDNAERYRTWQSSRFGWEQAKWGDYLQGLVEGTPVGGSKTLSPNRSRTLNQPVDSTLHYAHGPYSTPDSPIENMSRTAATFVDIISHRRYSADSPPSTTFPPPLPPQPPLPPLGCYDIRRQHMSTPLSHLLYPRHHFRIHSMVKTMKFQDIDVPAPGFG